MLYDAVIIGTGPAGLSAALNLKIHHKNFLWIGNPALSDKIAKAEKIDNFPGFSGISGKEMQNTFLQQVQDMGLSIQNAMVNTIMPMGTHYALMAGSDFYEAKTILLATGVASVGVLPGEEALLGRGVSYCATCDGGLYKGKTIAVIASSQRFAHEVSFLAQLAEKVYLFPGYLPEAPLEENVITMDTKVVGIVGAQKVSAVICKDGSELAVDGVFCLRDAISLNTLLPGLAMENGHITVDRTMATNLPGVFAAGDCTGRPYQYVKAAGEGNVAAHSLLQYLHAQA